jgi:type IX secretion system substrate protein/SprB-like repeat protein
MKNCIPIFCVLLFSLCNTSLFAQKTQNNNVTQSEDYEVQVTYAEYLGKTAPLRNLVPMAPASLEKRAKNKANRKEVKNFVGRGKYVSTNPDALPQGEDPVWQSAFNPNHSFAAPVEPLVNVEGMGDSDFGGNPPDPTIDVGDNYVIQMINASLLQIWDKEGNPVTQPIAANTIWSQIGFSSAGDPIVMYDHEADRWIITEFPNGNQLLFAITETNDPLGSWMAWNFSTPSFPDYPKYSIWPNAYCVTTNENGPGTLPNYFIDREAILNGDATVAIQRITIPGIGSGPGFQVSTPVDWTGATPPPMGADPIILSLNDDAWGASATDQIDIHTISIDWDNPNNSSVSTSSVVTSPFDTNPCAVNGPGFACIPQLNGQGLDGLPEVIMNQVHYRNFGTHESMVLNFITDATGTNVSGIRWMELRRTGGGDWELYQEGTFAPNDGLHRFMGGICMDGSGNIGLAYNISGEDIFAGIRFTGRRASDPLGEMTVDEYTLVDGENTLGSIRFGDYNHMSIDPANDRTFWFTGEYAGGGGWTTRIAAFELRKDTTDLGPIALLSPQSSPDLTNAETVSIEIKNFGLDTQSVYNIGYIFEGAAVVTETANYTLYPDSTYTHVFTPTVDMSTIGDYEFKIFTSLAEDQAILNDTLRVVVSKLPRFDAGISDILGLEGVNCASSLPATLVLTNFGTETLTSTTIEIELNSVMQPSIAWTGTLASGDSEIIPITLDNLLNGSNSVIASTSLPNGEVDEMMINDSFTRNFDVITNGVTITLELLTDNYPGETTWDLFDPMGNLIYSGGPYSSQATLFEEDFCLDPDLCYTFTIYDSYGDGICCGFGQGNYTIVDEQGNPLLSSTGEFGDEETNEFCATFECILGADFSTSPESEAGSADGVIMITALNGNGPFQYSIDGGANFQSSNIFNNLPGGDYDVVVTDGSGCTYEETVTVGVCALDIMAEVTNESSDGANDGEFTVTVTNGSPPYQYSIDDGGTFQSSPTFSGLAANTYTVVAEDANGCRTDLEIVIDFDVAINDLNFGYLIELFPNPTEGMSRINVKGLNQGSVFLKYNVYDVNGHLIQASQLTKYNDTYTGQLSLVSYPAGTYFIKFINKDIKRMLRLVKQ